MLMCKERSLLLVVDMQTSLVGEVANGAALVDHVCRLVRLANLLAVPVLATEQYPKGLGPTHPAVLAELSSSPIQAKVAFSCVAGKCLDGRPEWAREQVVIAGIEAHVCVLQTALDLLAAGREVFVVAEAVSARSVEDKSLALARLRDAGAAIVSFEMVGFEWLRTAGTPEFKTFSKTFLRG